MNKQINEILKSPITDKNIDKINNITKTLTTTKTKD